MSTPLILLDGEHNFKIPLDLNNFTTNLLSKSTNRSILLTFILNALDISIKLNSNGNLVDLRLGIRKARFGLGARRR